MRTPKGSSTQPSCLPYATLIYIIRYFVTKITIDQIPSNSLKSNTFSRYSKPGVNQWPMIAKIEIWVSLVQVSKEIATVLQVVARFSFSWERYVSNWSRIRRPTVRADVKGRKTPGRSLKICWEAGSSMTVNGWVVVMIPFMRLCSNAWIAEKFVRARGFFPYPMSQTFDILYSPSVLLVKRMILFGNTMCNRQVS